MIVDILREIRDEKNAQRTILETFKRAFGEHNEVELYFLRAKAIEHLQETLEQLDKHKDIDVQSEWHDAVESVIKSLSFHALNAKTETIYPLLSPLHIGFIASIIQMRKVTQDHTRAYELTLLANELEEALVDNKHDLSPQQYEMLTQMHIDIKEAVMEHEITGVRAFKKLLELFIGKSLVDRDILLSIKSEKIQSLLQKTYQKIIQISEISDAISNIYTKLTNILPSIFGT